MIQLHKAMNVSEGDGVTVKRLMPVHGMRNFDPFVLWDHFDIESGGFPDHPHRGFEAITWLFAGGMQHKDNLGNEGIIHAGGVQRFTAGRGIVHSEMPDGVAAGIQLWINLPKRLKSMPPSYQQIDIIEPETSAGAEIRTIVGKHGAITLQTAVEYLDIRLAADATLTRVIPANFRGIVYVVSGEIGAGNQYVAQAGALLVEDETSLSMVAKDSAHILWCFGLPHGEPIIQHGPFVD